MDTEKLKILRNTLSIPIETAINLLRNNDGDLAACEREFHDKNILEISSIAECSIETARESYLSCQYNITKAVNQINSKPVIITTKENPKPRNEIGFIICPMNEDGEYYKTTKRNDAFIPAADFDLIIQEFRSVFPLTNPWNGLVEDGFDICGSNFFDNRTCRQIIEKIKLKTSPTPTVERFLGDTIQWFEDKLAYATYIEVYGNQ